MSLRSVAFTLSASLALTGCAMGDLLPPQATLDNIQAVRATDIAPLKVGDFVPATGDPTDMDKEVSVRAGVQSAPGGSFARYLGDTLTAALKAAGKLDPNSSLVVTGMVTETHVDSAMPTARASLGAKFTLTRAGKVVFDKTLRVQATWDSDFMGAVAIPDALNHYVGLFSQLTTALFADPDFQAAAR